MDLMDFPRLIDRRRPACFETQGGAALVMDCLRQMGFVGLFLSAAVMPFVIDRVRE